MRAGLCSIQLQALTPEAASVVKHAVSLATRRGHAQVTPLHVASAMLTTSPSGLLRKACLNCHSHPLQCKALELCFNVAINRLPASTPTPLLGPHYNHHHGVIVPNNTNNNPSLSNALVAAFKRAQSHQRRGSIETQNQPILALKIEVEQLVISILDDPSVSRVMREAGFSSTIVKSKLEQPSSSTQPHTTTTSKPWSSSADVDGNHDDDVASVVSEVMDKRKNVVIVGDHYYNAERLARGVLERLGSSVNNVQVVSVPLVSFRSLVKEEVERKIMELRCLVKNSHVAARRGIVLYLGDLEWLVHFWSTNSDYYINNNSVSKKCYCPVEHMVMEVKRLVSLSSESCGKVCLMGVSTFKTYTTCKTCQPSLETLWDLHPFTVPVPTLTLSLNIHSDVKAKDGYLLEDENPVGVRKNLTCCRDCTVSFEKEANTVIKKEYCSSTTVSSSISSLPTWLQTCKQEKRDCPQESERVKDLCKKWNSFCSSTHCSSKLECELYNEIRNNNNGGDKNDVVCYDGNLIMFMPDHRNTNNNVNKPELLSNPNSSPNSASSSEANLDGLDSSHVFKDLSEENLKILGDALEKKVAPQNKHIVSEISSTVLRCRSEVTKRRRQDTWMVFSSSTCSVDEERENVSRELAKAVFGSYNNFVTVGNNTGFNDDKRSKRKRNDENENGGWIRIVERFGEAVNENPHRVFFIMVGIDGISKEGIKEAIQSGSLTLNGELVPLKDAIVIFSILEKTDSSSFSSESPKMKKKKKNEEDSLCLDLNIIAVEDNNNGGDDDQCNDILELVDKHVLFRSQGTSVKGQES